MMGYPYEHEDEMINEIGDEINLLININWVQIFLGDCHFCAAFLYFD